MAPWRPSSSLSVLSKEGNQNGGDNLFSRACCNRSRGDCFKIPEGKFRLENIKEIFFTMKMVKPLALVVQRDGRCPIPETIPSQVVWGSAQPAAVADVPTN